VVATLFFTAADNYFSHSTDTRSAHHNWFFHAHRFKGNYAERFIVAWKNCDVTGGVVQDPVFRALTDIGSPSNISRKDVVIVNAPSPGHSIYIASAKSTQGLPTPAHLRMLAPGYCTVLVTRVDDHTLLVRPHGGYLPPPGQRFADGEGSPPVIHVAYAYQQGDQFFRSSNYPMELGQRVELTGATAEVTALTPDGRPAEARIEFDVPLEAQSLEWLQWDWEREVYVPFQLPDVGETVRIPGPSEGLPVDWASLRSELLSWTE